MHSQEHAATHPLHGVTADVQTSMVGVCSSEVHNKLLCFVHIEDEIVVRASPGQAAHLSTVVCLISVTNETNHSRVICKLDVRGLSCASVCSHGSAGLDLCASKQTKKQNEESICVDCLLLTVVIV